ncbi:MAG: signal peptidase II, partial [Pyrinomonadaceae bacterium]
MDRRTLFWKLAYLLITVGAFLIDQTTKAYAIRYLRFGGEKSVISGFLSFAYAQNSGVAFSMFDQQGDPGRWGLSIVAFVA